MTFPSRKRHPLPVGSNGKQGSAPRIQRSESQAQPGTKGKRDLLLSLQLTLLYFDSLNNY